MESAPQELHEICHSFNSMLDRLHNSFERLNQFSADLAHDLRTPLNNLMVQTQVAISRTRTPEEYQTLLISNIEEYERLAKVTESILFLARAEHAHIMLNKTTLQIEPELQRIADYFEGVAEEHRIKIGVVAQGVVRADVVLLRRAVSNLVANAIHYTPAGDNITLTAQLVDGAMVISVINPGSGIDTAHLERIFDRFYRGDAARPHATGSAGLGLATSVANEMTVFKLVFPLSENITLEKRKPDEKFYPISPIADIGHRYGGNYSCLNPQAV